MKYIVLEPAIIEYLNNDCLRKCNIKRVDNNGSTEINEIFFQFDKSIKPPEDDDCDSYLLAVFMDAMKEGRSVIVKGTVSKGLLSNLVEYQSAWHKWLPDVYSLVEIVVDSVRINDGAVPGAICAFSGGVDGTFSVWRHSQGKYQYRSQEIKLCTMVHGFDIPLADATAFENASKSAKKTLDDININMLPIRTNFREISKVNWEHVSACALVAVLSNFKKVAGTCIVGSGESYDALVIPWGSSPLTDHLLSSDEFKVIHDGASHSRTEKVQEISAWKMGVDNLRVCWAGELKDRNCGKCEKCLRTQLNFLVTGNSIPSCFPDSQSSKISFKKIRLRNDVARIEWRQIVDFAKRNRVKGPFMAPLQIFLLKESIRNTASRTIKSGLGRIYRWVSG